MPPTLALLVPRDREPFAALTDHPKATLVVAAATTLAATGHPVAAALTAAAAALGAAAAAATHTAVVLTRYLCDPIPFITEETL